MRPGKPIRHGNKDFPSLKAIAEYYGVGSSAISPKIGLGIWRGKKLYYTEAPKNGRVNRAYIAKDQFKWLHGEKSEGQSADDFLASIITNAMQATA